MIEGKQFFAIRGYNKSGTNWLCRLLNLHPQISCVGEFHWNRITSQLIATFNESENLYGQTGLLDATWHRMDRFIKESIVLACDDDAIWVGDRTPSHIEPSIIIGARVFNLIRDGRDIMVSAAYHFFNNPEFFPEFNSVEELQTPLALFRADPNYFHRHPDQLLASDFLARNVAFFWADTIQKNQSKIDQNPELQCLEVRYEDLHSDTESERRRLYDFLDVDPAIAAPLAFNTKPGFEQEKPNKFLRKGVVGDWRNYFTPKLQDIFNEQAGETLIQLGYVDSLDWIEAADSGNTSHHSPPRELNSVDPAKEVGRAVDTRKQPSKLDAKQVAETVTMMSRARALLAYGGLDGVVQRPMFDLDGGVFPHFAVRAQGCRIMDSVGRWYIDWMNGWGPVLVGYNRPEVVEAIKNQMNAGPTLSLMHPLEIDVAELLVEMMPCAEMVAFGKNGSDAVNASLRIARAVTQRKMILQCGFHGFHEWYTCLHPAVEGMPSGLREQVEPFPYNDLDALESLLKKHQGNVAAVIMEPVNLKLPDESYLAGVRRLTEEYGCLMIFDEMVTAFRLANGGAQEYFGVVPDLACIGKGMANGMPLSAVVGKRAYMQKLPACGFGMTFRGETFSLAAAKAVLQLLQREPVCKHLANVGREVRERFEEISRAVGLNCVLAGPDSRMTIEFHNCGTTPQANVRSLFLQECLKHGVMTNGTLLPNYAHDAQAIDDTIAAFQKALKVVSVAVESENVDSSRPLGGSPTGPRAFVSNGFLESIEKQNGTVGIRGWMLLEDGAPDSIEIVANSGQVVPAVCCRRPDLEVAFPHQPTAIMAGYEASLPVSFFDDQSQYEFTILAKRGPQVAFRCLVVRQIVSDIGRGNANPIVGPYSTNDGVLYV
jgi:glutamate-1-semialdehyde 2,1-aminomutase